jgi:hypothetical protein
VGFAGANSVGWWAFGRSKFRWTRCKFNWILQTPVRERNAVSSHKVSYAKKCNEHGRNHDAIELADQAEDKQIGRGSRKQGEGYREKRFSQF